MGRHGLGPGMTSAAMARLAAQAASMSLDGKGANHVRHPT
jgi:hypothetical protein